MNVASVAIIVAVSFDMAKASVNDWRTILIAFAGLLLTFRYPRINSAWIVLGVSGCGLSALSYIVVFPITYTLQARPVEERA